MSSRSGKETDLFPTVPEPMRMAVMIHEVPASDQLPDVRVRHWYLVNVMIRCVIVFFMGHVNSR
jgi:hypothetical protein